MTLDYHFKFYFLKAAGAFASLFLIAQSLSAQMPELIYVGDPMCSWCYAFAPEISEVKKAFPDYDFKLVLGGLRPSGKETNAELGDFLKHHWQEIESRTGMTFNYDILDKREMVYDTEPSCRAVVAVREIEPQIALDFFKAVQRAFYVGNADMSANSTYASIAAEFGIDSLNFSAQLRSERVVEKTKKDFELSRSMGVTGFPTLIFRNNDNFQVISRGFIKAEDAIEKISKKS